LLRGRLLFLTYPGILCFLVSAFLTVQSQSRLFKISRIWCQQPKRR
jgi:hypothetical protein